MLHYVAATFVKTAIEMLLLFGGVFALAIVLWFVSQFIRGYGSGLLGKCYYYIVSPGVACHETGHALGCILTGTKIIEFVPFRPEGDTLGYVSYEARQGVWPQIAQFFISTGPVWFGCGVIMLLSRLLAGPYFLPSFGDFAPKPGDPISVHLFGVWKGAIWMLKSVFAPERWHSWLFPILLYLMFCIASEITLSPPDLNGMWRGFAAIFGVFFAVNLVPFAANWLSKGVDIALPAVFIFQTILFFVLLADLIFLIVTRIIWGLFGKRQ